jgi:signal transduction histidine kinase
VATASHELRTPLTSVHAALQVVVDGGAEGLQAEDRELLSISLANTERLVRLVNDLLDLSKITANRMPMALEPTPVAPLLAEVAQTMRALADGGGIELVIGAADAPECLADRDHILRVLANLVSNAVKYSPAGTSVTLSARLTGEAVEITVADQGPGIAADQADRLFRPFSRVGAQQRQLTGGTGLGLAISRAVVEQHGGRMWWEPNTPAGSRFVFTLPIARGEVADTAA